jgi:4'-phosphopantetheinyl transferase
MAYDETAAIDLPERVAGVPSVWMVDAEQQWAVADRLAPRILTPAERRRAAAIHVESRRIGYVIAHLALRLLLGSFLGVAAPAVRLVREGCPKCGALHGRPAVEGGGVHFSLARSHGVALLALADVPVGVDVERIPPPETASELGARLHPLEAAALAAAPDACRPAMFARTWVRKEAYLKGLGCGLARDVARDHVGAGSDPAALPGGWLMQDVPVRDGYAGAVAVCRPV